MQATVKGKITKITGFGAFVSTDDGKTGMIHISEISSGFADSAFGGFASAADVVLGGHALEVYVPAVELALSHDELGSYGRSSIDGGSCGLSCDVFCGFFSFLCHDFEVFGV